MPSGNRRTQLASRSGRVPLALVLVLALALPASTAAADPLPVQDPGKGTVIPATPAEAQVAAQVSASFGVGDVFVAVGNGQVQWRLPDGTLNATLDTGLGGYTTGKAFDKAPGNLYVTNFSVGAVTRFVRMGTDTCEPEPTRVSCEL